MAKYPDSTKTSLEQRLRARARERWPQIASLQIRHRGNFSYADAALADGTTLKLCRLRYVGSASQWQFAIYRASHDDYDESVFPTGLPVGTCQDCQIREDGPRLEQDAELNLFRILQEAVTNVEKHAHATTIQVCLEFRSDSVVMSIEDDGRAFNPMSQGTSKSRGHGIGLRNIRERTESMAGVFEIQSVPGTGTTLRVQVPRAPKERE